jgi:hypothetical protein
MNYQATDIDFRKIPHAEFERLCFELLLKLGYRQLIWRRGGADNGRDIEGIYSISTPLTEESNRWFFECKHYENGVPPEQLHAKLAWADAEQPQYLVFFISSYLSNNARTWLAQIAPQKHYHIKIIEGPELRELLLKFPEIIEQFFANDSYMTLLADTKRHWQTYRVLPNYDLLWVLARRIDPQRLTLNELGFLFISLYQTYDYDPEKDDYYGGLDPKVLEPLYDRLAEVAIESRLTIIDKYKESWEWVQGCGFADELRSYIPGMEGEVDVSFQFNELHLLTLKPEKTFAIGNYLFFISPTGVAFELFSVEDSEFTTQVRIYPVVSPTIVDQLIINKYDEFDKVLKKFALAFKKNYQLAGN